MNKLPHLVLFILLLTGCGTGKGDEHPVKNIEDFNEAVANAQPGTSITMANGVWTNSGGLKTNGEAFESKNIVVNK